MSTYTATLQNHVKRMNSSVGKEFKVADLALALIFAISVLSPFGWSAFLLIGGQFLPEPVILAFLSYAFLTKSRLARIMRSAMNGSRFWAWSILTAFLFAVGVIMHGDFLAAYSDARSMLLLGFSASLIMYCKDKDFGATIRIFRLILFVSLAAHVLSFFTIRIESETAKFVYPIAALTFLIFTASYSNNPLLSTLFVCLLSIVISITSSYRLYYFFSFISILYLISIYAKTVKSRISRGKPVGTSLMLGVGVAAVLVLAYPAIETLISNFFNANESRYIQSIAKWNDLIYSLQYKGELEGARSEYYSLVARDFIAFFPPSGLGQKAMIGQWGSLWSDTKFIAENASSNDGTHLFLIVHFGLLLTLVIAWDVVRATLLFIKSSSVFPSFYTRISIPAVTIIYCYFTSIFSQTALAFSFGAIVGLIYRSPRSRESSTATNRRPPDNLVSSRCELRDVVTTT